jgi:hypothetical protein
MEDELDLDNSIQSEDPTEVSRFNTRYSNLDFI